MHRNSTLRSMVVGLGLAVVGSLAHAQPQSFTYQGELRNGNNLSQGPHDLRFELLDAGGVVRQTLCADNVPVQEGRFTVLLDPGIEFPGLLSQLISIRILVRANAALPCSDTSGFTALSPTQPFTRAPLASRASLADRALTTDTFGGQAPSFYSDAGNLSGVLADARLSSNVPRIAANNVFTGANRFGSIGIGTPFPLFPLSITSTQATAYLATTSSPNGSVLILENNSPNISSNGGLLGAVNFNTSGSTPGQLSYRLDPAGPLAHSMRFRVGDVTQAVLTGSGQLGIGITSPNSNLDILATQATATLNTSNNQNGSVLTLANGSPILATNGGTLGAVNFQSGIGTEGQIAYQWDPASRLSDSLQFRVGGLPRAALTGAGSLGIGVLAPEARLHVRRGPGAGLSPNPNSTAAFEASSSHYVSLLSTNSTETGFLFGRPVGGAEEAGIIYNSLNTLGGLDLRAGGNVTRLAVTGTGVIANVPFTAPDVRFTGPTTSYASISQFDWVARNGSVFTTGLGNGGASFANGTFDSMAATVRLPHGALVQSVRITVDDNNPGNNLLASFEMRPIGTLGNFTTVTQSTAFAAGRQTLIFSGNGTVIDNLNNEYFILVRPTGGGAWTSFAAVGASIEYTVTRAVP